MERKPVVSDLVLEQFLLGELPADQAERVRRELEQDPELRARRDAIERSDGEILERYPPPEIAASIRGRLLREKEPRARRPIPFLVGLPAAAAVLVFAFLFIARERVADDQTRMKGLATHLAVFRKTPQGAEELRPGSAAARGDVVQLSYAAGDARYGAIFSVDGRGTITWHLPAGYAEGPRAAPALDRQGPVLLPSAYQLDDAPGFERFFLVFSANPFDLAAVSRAARDLASRPAQAEAAQLALPAGLKQVSFLVRKKGSSP